ncbi:MAG: phosphatidate cytidylyltransferase [Planctomycetaceae bacterium]|nr:phosphatidate cytidylyltransferase [Planctomycetaceae bacterium]
MLALIDNVTWQRWFGVGDAFADPVTVWIVSGIAAALAISGVAIWTLISRGRVSEESATELKQRWISWCWLIVAIAGPILLGAFWTVLAVCLLSLLCFREYARATGLFRERMISVLVVLGIGVLTLAVLDHFDRLYFATAALGVLVIVIGTLWQDRPTGFIQRVALGSLGFLLFGFSLGYLGLMTTTPDYRPILLMTIAAVELNDVFAFCCGKLIGGPKWLPNTSPGKTISGAVGALVLTTILVAVMGHFVFMGTSVDRWDRLMTLGVLVSGLGQLGDLTLSSIKRDLKIKDISHTIPGHGGLLDRFDSLVLVVPAVYHFLSLYLGPLGADQPMRVFTGG